jgi:molybdopterin-guanine dinucleotide biosynthesis protein
MPVTTTESALTLTAEERTFLAALLKQALHDKQIEEHRTDSIEFKEHVEHEVTLLRGLLDKVRRP